MSFIQPSVVQPTIFDRTNSLSNTISSGLAGLVDTAKSGFDKGVGALDNMLTGDRDYNRQLELLGLEQAFNASEAQKQREFAERMRDTSYQAAIKDLQAAGLNPYLAYSQGGAAVPTGYSASSHASGYSGSSQGLGQLLRVFASLVATGASAAKASPTINKYYLS